MSDISGLGEFFCHACTLPDNTGELRRKYFNLTPFERKRLKEVRAALDRVLEVAPRTPSLTADCTNGLCGDCPGGREGYYCPHYCHFAGGDFNPAL